MCLPLLAAAPAAASAAAASTATASTFMGLTAAQFAALSIGTSIASTGLMMAGQNAQAKAQAAYQTQLGIAQNEVNAINQGQVRSQEAQAMEASARDAEKARQANRKAASTAKVAAGEAGVTGASVDALLSEYDAQLGRFMEATSRQQTLTKFGANDQVFALSKGGGYERLRLSTPVYGANYAAGVLSVASSALGTLRDYNPAAFQKPSGPPRG